MSNLFLRIVRIGSEGLPTKMLMEDAQFSYYFF